MLNLEYKTRGDQTLGQLRFEGRMPAVFYGPKEDATPISVIEKDFIALWKESGGSSIVSLKGDAGEKEVLIHEVSPRPVKDGILHADFYAIERGKKLTVSVPFDFIGEAPIEKQNGILVKVMTEIEVESKPSAIPQSLEIDLSQLIEFSSVVKVSDIKLPDGAEIHLDSESVIVSVSEAQEESEPEEERTIDDVEIEEKGKADAEGEKEGE